MLKTFFLLLPEAPCFPFFYHFSRFSFSSHSSPSQFLTMNLVLIPRDYSHESCMQNTAKGSNTSRVISLCLSALHPLLLSPFLFYHQQMFAQQITSPSPKEVPFQTGLNTQRSMHVDVCVPCVSMRVFECLFSVACICKCL